jgi:hypothetical protein
MTLPLLLSWSLAVIAAGCLAALVVLWPRRLSAEEWVLRRRAAAAGGGGVQPAPSARRVLLGGWPLRRLAAALALVGADLRLLEMESKRAPAGVDELSGLLLQLALLGAGGGLLAGGLLWLAGGRQGLPAAALLLAITCGVLMPALRWLRLRRQARQLRALIRQRLPRLLTGARVLLESGACTPQEALAVTVSVYRDPAAAVLREALRDQHVHRKELPQALEEVAQRYELEPLQRLADTYRVGGRYGTPVANLIAEFAFEARQSWHGEYRERMTRAPVLMTLPALLFFIFPLLALVMFLVFSPLLGALSQLG